MPYSQSITLHFLKNYKDLVRKIAQHGYDASSDASTALPSKAAVVQQQAHYILAEFEQQRTRVETSFERSFSRLKQLAAMDAGALRTLYYARKQHAKQRLRDAIRAKLDQLGYIQQGGAATSRAVAQAGSAPTAAVSSADADAIASTSGRTVPVVPEELQPLFGTDGVLRSVVLHGIYNASRAFMTGLNTTRVEGAHNMQAALDRAPGTPLITVSNHVAALDDPLVMATMMPPDALDRPSAVRWTLCASDRCFKYAAAVPFFRAGKVLPVVRGGGMAQPGMVAAEARLAAGDWVHIFPEGTRSRNGGAELGPMRKGVGRLVASCVQAPLVLPFVHSGMERIMPRGQVLPAVGQDVHVLVGEPVPVEDLLSRARSEGWSDDRLHTAVTARVGAHLKALKVRLDTGEVVAPEPGPEDGQPGGGVAAATVSSLDQFDPQDLLPYRRGVIGSAWEKVKFKMQHRYWLVASETSRAWSSTLCSAGAGASNAGGAGSGDNAQAAPATLRGPQSRALLFGSWAASV